MRTSNTWQSQSAQQLNDIRGHKAGQILILAAKWASCVAERYQFTRWELSQLDFAEPGECAVKMWHFHPLDNPACSPALEPPQDLVLHSRQRRHLKRSTHAGFSKIFLDLGARRAHAAPQPIEKFEFSFQSIIGATEKQ
jgi:hypothetical protein